MRWEVEVIASHQVIMKASGKIRSDDQTDPHNPNPNLYPHTQQNVLV